MHKSVAKQCILFEFVLIVQRAVLGTYLFTAQEFAFPLTLVQNFAQNYDDYVFEKFFHQNNFLRVGVCWTHNNFLRAEEFWTTNHQ